MNRRDGSRTFVVQRQPLVRRSYSAINCLHLAEQPRLPIVVDVGSIREADVDSVAGGRVTRRARAIKAGAGVTVVNEFGDQRVAIVADWCAQRGEL